MIINRNGKKYRVNIIFDRRKRASKTHRGAVEIEVCCGDVRRRLSSGVLLFADEWNATLRKVVRRRDAEALNTAIQDKIDATIDAINQGDTEAEAVSPRRITSFSPTEWMRRQMEARPLADNTRKNHEALFNELDASGMFRRWSDFTPRSLAIWEARLRNVRGITKTSTIYDYHKRLRVYVGQAVMMGLLRSNPYDRYKVVKGRPEDTIRYVTDAERERIVLVADPTPVWLRILAAVGFTGVSWLGWDLTIPQTMWHRRRDV